MFLNHVICTSRYYGSICGSLTSIKPNSITVIPPTAAKARRRRAAKTPGDTRAAPARPPAGARLPGRPQRLHFGQWGRELRLARPAVACPQFPRPNGVAPRGFPGPVAQPSGSPGPPAAPTRWRMSPPPAAMTGGGATAPHGARHGWTCVSTPVTRGRLHPPPRLRGSRGAPARRPARGLKLDREGVGDIEAASLLGQGRWEPRRRPGRSGPSEGRRPDPWERRVPRGTSPRPVPPKRKSGRQP